MHSASELARHESNATRSPAPCSATPDNRSAPAYSPSLASAIAIGLCVASGTPWIDLFPRYRVCRFGGEVFAVMAVYAFVLAALWAYSERASPTRSPIAFVLRSVSFAMCCCGIAAATWICALPSDSTLGSIGQFAASSVFVAVCAALVPVWVKPWLCVLIAIGAPLFVSKRAVARRALSPRCASAIVALCSIAASSVFAVLAWTDRVPASVATSAYALELARYLPIAAISANALVVLLPPRASRCARAHTLAFRVT